MRFMEGIVVGLLDLWVGLWVFIFILFFINHRE